jgi:exopolysaccharide biosynthesis polyprenyl glycosylphosphotransferase
VVGGIQEIAAAVRRMDADTIAVAGVTAVPSEALRRLSWELEGSGVDLVVAPAITDIAGPRIVVRPMNGLPVLHVGEPAFSGAQRVLKHGIEVMISALLLLVLFPLLLAVAVLIKLTTPGPVLFKQGRVGHGGRFFVMYKFRTMRCGAESERDNLSVLNELDGPLFKLRSDPRVTPFGRWLRRYSVDELPQLWNVLMGSMSLVGPRPPLPEEVDAFPIDARRRLLVKPGITGLWQVSGRSDLSWEETLRLDLYYIDNWSVPYDLALLWRTVTAVLAGRGAY